MESLVGCLLCLLCLAVWVGCRVEDTRAIRAACSHQWKEPMVFAGYWTRHCKLCGHQEPCPPPSGNDDNVDRDA